MVKLMKENERNFFISKDVLDTVNSFSWFLMDASWMLQMQEISMAMILPTLLSAIFLCYIEKRKSVTYINLAIVSWITMNVSWMFSENFSNEAFLTAAKIFFLIGVALIIMAVLSSRNISETFSHFKRFRIKTYFK
jgi:hypothetical protein